MVQWSTVKFNYWCTSSQCLSKFWLCSQPCWLMKFFLWFICLVSRIELSLIFLYFSPPSPPPKKKKPQNTKIIHILSFITSELLLLLLLKNSNLSLKFFCFSLKKNDENHMSLHQTSKQNKDASLKREKHPKPQIFRIQYKETSFPSIRPWQPFAFPFPLV